MSKFIFPRIFANIAFRTGSARESLQVGSSNFTWSLLGLQRATRRLIHRLVAKGKLCLFIDGLDEYDGHYPDIIELLQEFASLPNLKLCLSSRPLLIFENAFTNFASLRLQDLTQPDITLFVRDNLRNNAQMLDLMSEEPKAATNLVQEIVTKADGVFLWVRLVVKSLLDGLRDGDHTIDLQQRLKNTPPDLESLYQYMLSRMEPDYAVQASEIFQIVHSHYNGMQISKISLYLFSLGRLRDNSKYFELVYSGSDLEYLLIFNCARPSCAGPTNITSIIICRCS